MGARLSSATEHGQAFNLGDVVLALRSVEAADIVRPVDMGTLRAARAGGETTELTPQDVGVNFVSFRVVIFCVFLTPQPVAV